MIEHNSYPQKQNYDEFSGPLHLFSLKLFILH